MSDTDPGIDTKPVRPPDIRWYTKHALGIVNQRKRLIAGLFLVIALVLVVAVLSIPRSYEVTGKLVVTHARADMLVSPSDPVKPNLGVTLPTLQDMAVHA